MTRVISDQVARQTGTRVQVVDRGMDDFERQEAKEQGIEWARWETICVDHGNVCSHYRRVDACAFAAAPVEWCEDCAEAQS